MANSDTAAAKKYASIAEVAAAQAQLYYNEMGNASEYAGQAQEYAEQAQSSADTSSQLLTQVQSYTSIASSAQESASQSSTSAQASATDAASSAESAGAAAQEKVDSFSEKLASSDDGGGDNLIIHIPSAENADKTLTVNGVLVQIPSIYNWTADSTTDDSSRFTKAVASTETHIFIPQKIFKIGEVDITRAIHFIGQGGVGLDQDVGTFLQVDNDAAYGLFFDGSSASSRPTGGSLQDIGIGCANRTTMGSPDLVKFLTWSHFKIHNIAPQNTTGWALRFQDFMEWSLTVSAYRAIGSETTGVILFDDYIGSYSGNNVNNGKIYDATFGGCSGPWIKSTAQSNPDMIWLRELKFEYDAILASANTTNKYVIDFLNMSRCWIEDCGFTYLSDINNMYQAALHMGPLCGFSTNFSNNKFFGMRAPWFIEGGRLVAKNNESNQASYTSSANMGGIVTSSKACEIEPVKHVTSNLSMTRGALPDAPGFISAHNMGGNINNSFVVDAQATKSTVMSVAAATQVRQITLPAHVLDGKSVVNLAVRVKCVDTSGSNSSIAVIAGSTTLDSKTLVAANGWQILKFQLKPAQLTTAILSIVNSGAVQILFDGATFEKSSYIDWNFAISPGTIAADGIFTSPTQSYSDTIGVAGLIQSISGAGFNGSAAGLMVSVTPLDSNGSFNVILYNPTSASITTTVTRCFVRLFLNI